MNAQELLDTARMMVADGKGLLAMNEKNRLTKNRSTRSLALRPIKERGA